MEVQKVSVSWTNHRRTIKRSRDELRTKDPELTTKDPELEAFIFEIEPKDKDEALNDERWILTMQEELN